MNAPLESADQKDFRRSLEDTFLIHLKGIPLRYKLRDLILFTFYYVAISSHPSCKTPERSTALWVLWDDRTPLPCTPVRTPSLKSTQGVSKLPDFRLFLILRLCRRSRTMFLSVELNVSKISDFDFPGYFRFRKISRMKVRKSRLKFIDPRFRAIYERSAIRRDSDWFGAILDRLILEGFRSADNFPIPSLASSTKRLPRSDRLLRSPRRSSSFAENAIPCSVFIVRGLRGQHVGALKV